MKASQGDHIVLAGKRVGEPTRDGRVVEVRGEDGGPPYVVEWSDGHTGVIFPDAGSVLQVSPAGGRDESAPSKARPHVREWTVRVSIVEADDDTDAQAVLVADSPGPLTAAGRSHRAPEDRLDPQIGDEVAVARALRHLADVLMSTAESDISAVTGQDAQVRRT